MDYNWRLHPFFLLIFFYSVLADFTEESSNSNSKSQQACENYDNSYQPPLGFHIRGGRNASEKEFPHIAALGFYSDAEKEYQFLCGGTIISELYVVTAAHCIKGNRQAVLDFVRVGVLNLPASVETRNSSTDVQVKSTTLHPDYNNQNKHNDIALVKLAKVLEWTARVRPACLYSKNDDPKEKLMILGWGEIDDKRQRSDILQKADVNCVTLDDCSKIYSALLVVTKNHFCADTKSDTCKGDSGGPLQTYEPNRNLATLVAVTSTGVKCGTNFPGIYTRISSYVDWIENIVW